MTRRGKTRLALRAGILLLTCLSETKADDPPRSVTPRARGDSPETQSRECPESGHSPGWCEPCGAGYLLGIRVPSKLLYDAMDPHGHDIDSRGIDCALCQRAISNDGFCERHRRGFVAKRLYHSRLTYLIQMGRYQKGRRGASLPGVPAKDRCRCDAGPAPAGRDPASPSWCETCEVGRVGELEFVDRELYRQALAELKRLRAAIALAARCEWCSVAFFEGGHCPRCRITYRADPPVPSRPRSRPSGG